VITDRELDGLLAGTAGVRDADLPAPPEDFLRDLKALAGSEQMALVDTAENEIAENEPASVIAARQLVSDARAAHASARTRNRPPSRRVVVRVGAAVLAVAAAWTTAVVITPSDDGRTPGGKVAAPSDSTRTPGGETDAPPSGPFVVDGMTLVAAERVTFPVSVDPVPEGLTPSFSRYGGPTPFGDYPVMWSAAYRSAHGDQFWFEIQPEDPREEWEFEHELPQWGYANSEITETGPVRVGGIEADLVRGTYDRPNCRNEPSTPVQTEEPGEVCASSFADLFWERADGQWVWLRGEDAYADTASVVAIAESLVDRPQPVDLQIGLSPEGWVMSSYEDNGISFVNSADPSQRLAVTLMERWRRETVENAFQGMYDGPEHWVTVNGRPAKIVLVDQGEFNEWFLAGELDGGVLFMIQTPEAFTQEQVIALAEQVTYTP
jgi:hypothetical protein